MSTRISATRPLSGLRRASQFCLWAGGGVLLLTTGIILSEIVVRRFFGSAIQGVDEIAGYGMAISFALAMPNTIFRRSHVSVDVIYQLLPKRTQMLFDLFSVVAFALYISILAYSCVSLTLDSFHQTIRSTGLLATPLYIPQTFWAIGMTFTAVVLAVILLHMALALLRRDWGAVETLAGRSDLHTALSEENIDEVLDEAKEQVR